MKRYADVDKLIEFARNSKDGTIDANDIARFPTEDVVEVVRCKDCKHSSPNKVYGCRFEPFNTLENGERMYSDDFCSCGERAEE